MNVQLVKDVLEIVNSGVATAAIILGGVWAWLAFFRRRLSFPRACVEHAVTHRRFGASTYLVHVSLIVENRGEVLLRVRSMIVRLQQVLPEPPDVLQTVDAGQNPVPEGQREIAWPLLAQCKNKLKNNEHEIEPGETERIECDFFIPDYVRTIEVYSHIQNDSKRGRDIGWTETTFYDLVEPSARSSDSHTEATESESQTRRTAAASEAAAGSGAAAAQARASTGAKATGDPNHAANEEVVRSR